jgi:hypothetical protein
LTRPIGRLDKCKSVQSFWFALQRNSSLDDDAAKLYSPTLPPQVPARLADPVGGNNYLLAPRTGRWCARCAFSMLRCARSCCYTEISPDPRWLTAIRVREVASDFDDDNRQFLILFGKESPPPYSRAKASSEPFSLMEEPKRKASTVMLRTGQQRFRFQVMSRYGQKCAVCDIRHPQLLKAAHICGKSEKGTDDWRNGIPLCSTHHDAFDNHFFCIEPSSSTIMCKPGVSQKDIGLRELKLAPLKNCPHRDALQWRWDVTQKEWNGPSTKMAE